MSNHNWTLETQLVHNPFKTDSQQTVADTVCDTDVFRNVHVRLCRGICNKAFHPDLKRDVKQALQQVKEGGRVI
jgi:hypothetical protein